MLDQQKYSKRGGLPERLAESRTGQQPAVDRRGNGAASRKRMRRLGSSMRSFVALCAVTIWVAASGQVTALGQSSPYSQVDPFVGTQTNSQHDNGNTVPGATRPFGMLYWSPDPVDGAFYRYEKPVTRGFSLTHLSGPGCGVYGDVPILPMLGLPRQPPPNRTTPYTAGFRHADEVAQPGYYSVRLDSGITVRLAAGLRSGIATIEYPEDGDAHTLLVDLSRNLTQVYDAEIEIEGGRVSGSVASGNFCGLENRYRVYFALETEEKPSSVGSFDELGVKGAETGALDARDSGPRVGGYLGFAPGVKTVHLKVGISFVSIANARANMAAELPGWDFEKVRAGARSAWEKVLDHIVVEGGSEAQRKTFYTAMYHSFLHPTVFSDVNGEYMGFDRKVHRTGRVQYANFSGWDIYRTQVQLIAMLMPEVASDLAQSLVMDAEQGGGLPIWPVANDESSCMVGDPADGILASIYAFGGRNFDTKGALAAMVRGADDPSAHIRRYPERPGLQNYLANGYVTFRAPNNGAASMTLEYQSADFAIARFAASLNERATAQRYLERSAQWRKLFDPETKYLRARDAKGNFLPNFEPAQWDGFVEGNAAQYTWMVPYDLAGLIEAIGGDEAVNTRLDHYFSQYGQLRGGPYFYIANEPSFGNPWIYNWSGQPWRTQEVVRKTLTDLFQPKPDGEPGNDDLGATSSWAIFASLGLYPEVPGVGGFAVSSPVFPRVTLRLGGAGGGHLVEIVAPGAPEKLYVQKIAVDGRAVNNWWIGWEELAKAARVDYILGAERNRDPRQAPPSFGSRLEDAGAKSEPAIAAAK